MSAWIVSKEHIDTLVAGLWMPEHEGYPTYYHNGEPMRKHYDPSEVGQMLWDENYRSVNYRYDENKTAPRYTYTEPQPVSAVQLIKSIDCYEYQSCETPDWPDSEAYTFCQALRSHAIGKLPGYDEAHWGVPSDAPANR